jgi:hypothetical protein
MPVTITGSSTGLLPGAFSSGTILQTTSGYNNTAATKVFSGDGTFEDVPGNLRTTITPLAVGNTMVISAHLHWGGAYGTSNDISANFRIYKSTNSGSTWSLAGNYSTANATAFANCATGHYTYNWGDGNASNFNDHILIHETVASTSQTIYAVHWAAGYSASGARTFTWNRPWGLGNDYNPVHVCTIQAYEVKA